MVRDRPVLLAADVALIFAVETREIVQNIKANPDIFPEKYAFQLTDAEAVDLRSAGLISKPGRGGSRALPWVVTRKGAIRLATIMRSPRVIRAADIFVDIFDDVIRQIQAGAGHVAITNPSQIGPSTDGGSMLSTARSQLVQAIKALFDTVIDERRNTTVADELQAVSAEAVSYVKAWLKGKSIANDKIEAETMLIIEQARDMYERRQADLAERALDRERKALENFQKRIDIAEKMLALYKALEPNALVALANSFGTSGIPQLNRPQRAIFHHK